MADDRDDRTPETPLPQGAEQPRSSSANILDALDMAGVGEIDIAFERPFGHPRPAPFD